MGRNTRNYLGRNLSRRRHKDRLSKERRSSLMAKIRSKGSRFESNFIRKLKARTKIRFETNVTSMRGKPDIVFPKKNVCVFLDSDFWHGWQYPRWAHVLKNAYWREKINGNRRRDLKNTRYLRRHGWRVLRLWEHSILNQEARTIKRVLTLIN